MALTIDTAPALIGLVKNEVKYELSTDDYYSTAGSQAIRLINFTNIAGGPADADYFTITWTDAFAIVHTHTLTFKDAPSGENEIVSFAVAGGFMDDYVRDNVMPWLASKYALNRDFYVILVSADANNAQISIEAKVTGTGFNISGAESATDLAYVDTAGVIAVARTNFSIWVDLLLEEVFKSGEFDVIKQFALKVNENLEADLYLEKYLKSYLSYDLPSYNQAVVSYSANLLKRYYIFLTEAYGDPAAAISWSKNPSAYNDFKFVLFGGKGFTRFWGNSFVADYCTAKNGKKFFTNRPAGIKVATSSHLFLSFFVTSDGIFVIYLKMYFSDGADSTVSVNGAASKDDYVATIPASIDQLNPALGGHAKTDITKYEIYVKDYAASANKTETITFIVDQTNHVYSKQFIFINSLGGVDTLWATGKSSKNSDFDFNELEKFADNSSAGTSQIIRANQLKNKAGFQNSFKASTGFKSKAYIDYLQEFFDSEAVFEVIDSKYVEVMITSKGQELFKDDEHLYALEFEYKYGFVNNAYTSDL